MRREPWHDLPVEVVWALRPALADIADEVIAAVREIPAYARPLEGEFGRGLRAGVEAALRHFVAEIEAGGPVVRSDAYVMLGRGEMRAGRSLEALLSAYRAGARVAWRRFAEIGGAAGLPPHTMYQLAESIFAYIDVLSAESAEGHALEQSAAASEAELRRRRLVRLLVRDPAPDAELVRAVAADAQWPLPRSLAVLAIAGPRGEAVAAHLPPDAIAETIGEVICALVPDPRGPGRREQLERAVAAGEARAGLGTAVPWPEAALSFHRARAALELGAGRTGLIAAEGRAGELLLRADPRLAGELVAERLAPLDGLAPGARARLIHTLQVWLEEQGRVGAVASRLGVHTQTVRYRMDRLRERFGPALEDPEGRLWLQLALRFEAAQTAASG
ncbi:MAG TPA: helix-turn-helix domain-containing protein [Solirubrobacteraceae bacterium]|nr:helix-turn-helix domain-containing protein [Solirubrobacteraceae bacterium]